MIYFNNRDALVIRCVLSETLRSINYVKTFTEGKEFDLLVKQEKELWCVYRRIASRIDKRAVAKLRREEAKANKPKKKRGRPRKVVKEVVHGTED